MAVQNGISNSDGTGGLPYIYIGRPDNVIPAVGSWTSIIIRDLDSGTSKTLDRSFSTNITGTNQALTQSPTVYDPANGAATWAFRAFYWQDSNNTFLPIFPSTFTYNGGNFEIEFI